MSSPSVALPPNIPSDLEIEDAIRAFDESKAGVKGLVDSRITTVPSIFIEPPESYRNNQSPEYINSDQLRKHVVPVIDLSGRREDIIVQIGEALERWGVFQAVNHGVPLRTLDEMLLGVTKFHELPAAEKQRFYTRDLKKKVVLASTFDLFIRKRANWRDTIHCDMAPDPPSPEELPMPLRQFSATCSLPLLGERFHSPSFPPSRDFSLPPSSPSFPIFLSPVAEDSAASAGTISAHHPPH